MARRGDLAGLAALGALGYMLSKGDKAAPTGGGGGRMPAAAPEAGPSIDDDMRKRALAEGEKVSEGERVSRYKPNPFDVEDAGGGYDRKPVAVTGTRPTVKPSVNAVPRLIDRTPPVGTGSGGGRGPTAEELAAYTASRQSASNNRYPEVRGSSADSLAAENRRKIRAGSEAVEGVYPEQMVGGPGLRTAQTIAKNLAGRFGGKEAAAGASPYLKEIPYAGPKQLPNAPTKQLTGPSKGELMTRDRAARASSRNEEMLRENARRSGLDPDNMNPAVAQRVREGLGGSDFSLGMKRGGSVKSKVKKMASGGIARSGASKRADGIATKGKTRGKIC